MAADEIAAIGYATSMLAFAMLSALQLGRWKSSPYSRHFGLASGATAAWGCVLTLQSLGFIPLDVVVLLAEWARNALWLVALLMVLRTLDSNRVTERYAKRFGLPIAAVVLILLTLYSGRSFDSLAESLIVSGGIVMSILLLSLIEQVFRNLPSDSSSSMKYVCVALLAISVYDILFFVHALTTGAVDATDAWAARGFVTALVVAPLALASRRSASEGPADIPRQVFFYTFSLMAVGFSIVLWLMADYYLGEYGGTWGNVASIVLGAAVLCGLAVLLVSSTIQSRVRVFLTKAFFQYKYDYRKEWLRFIGTLSESGLEHVPTTSVRAVAPIVNSPGGIVWVREHEGNEYKPVGAWQCELPVASSFARDSSMVRFLREQQWVIDLNELKRYPSRYNDLQIDPWFEERDDLWLVVPMLVGKRLFGFIALLKPKSVPTLNFEDHDLLKTVGRHVGTHIKQADSDRRLAESSQFGTYHRLSAFLMHDLNNLIAQQSMLVQNAEKFRHDPKFVDDTVETIAHSVTRMRRLMEQLSGVSKAPKSTRVSINDVLRKAVKRSSQREPKPALAIGDDEISINADQERLTMVIEHLIRNAQDATEGDGSINVDVVSSNAAMTITIRDTGSGMSPEFVSERLFRPFDSTKGSQSMGIGAYQAREYVRMLGGQLDVESEVGQGTTFSLRLPLL